MTELPAEIGVPDVIVSEGELGDWRWSRGESEELSSKVMSSNGSAHCCDAGDLAA